MKLYYSPGACSLSPHIVMHEAGHDFEAIKVDLKAKKTEHGDDFLKINPKGQVPVLMLDNGETLTEGPAIVQYLADLKPAAGLAPANGSFDRVRLQEWLNYVSTEIHKGIGQLFNPLMTEDYKPKVRAMMATKLAWLDEQLATREYLTGHYSLADIYAAVCIGWTAHVGIDISEYKHLNAWLARVHARPAVQAALQAEGLSKKAA